MKINQKCFPEPMPDRLIIQLPLPIFSMYFDLLKQESAPLIYLKYLSWAKSRL